MEGNENVSIERLPEDYLAPVWRIKKMWRELRSESFVAHAHFRAYQLTMVFADMGIIFPWKFTIAGRRAGIEGVSRFAAHSSADVFLDATKLILLDS